jgi:centriolar protein POC1
LWFPGTNIKTKVIKGHTAAVKSIAFFNDGKTILSASDDKSVKLWDIDTQKFKASYSGHNNWVNSAQVNQEMTLLCSGGEDKKLVIWDIETKKQIQVYSCF